MADPGLTRRRLLRGCCAFGLLVVATTLMPLDASRAFPPTKLLGLGNASHASITEEIVYALDREYFGVEDPTKTMRRAKSQMVDANAAVDDDQFHSAMHFDGENFAGGQARIIALRAQVRTALADGDGETARQALGSALHTVQDFYAHSNWVELHGAIPNGDLGRPGRSLGPVSPPSEATCDESRLITSKLTSGYYGGEDRRPPVPGKCRHGGPFDDSPGDGGINKDSPIGLLSPHAEFHEAAATAARAGTRQFIEDIAAEISEDELRLLLGAGPSLGMSIDTTGSMGPVIAGVKRAATAIVDDRLGTDEEPIQYVLAPFNDPDVPPATATNDPDTFKAALQSLTATGGGDCPELAMTGLLNALFEMERGGELFLFTDADAKDAGLASVAVALASARDITIHPILFGSCDERVSEAGQDQIFAAGPPSTAATDPSYEQLAIMTGGQVFALDYGEAEAITTLADRLARSDAVRVLNLRGALESGGAEHTFPVDGTMTAATVSVSGTTTVELRRPDGSVVLPTDPGVEITTLTGGQVIGLEAPDTGEWTVVLGGSSAQYSLRVTGESSLDLDSLQLLEPAETHEGLGYTVLDGYPVAGQALTAYAALTEGVGAAVFEMRRTDGTLVQTLALEPTPDGNEFVGDVTIPSERFVVYAAGVDSGGAPYQRVIDRMVTPQDIQVSAPEPVTLLAGEPTTLEYTVENFGAAGTFTIAATDDVGYIQDVTPETLELGPGERATVSITVEAPAGTEIGATQTLTVDVVGIEDPARHNFAVLVNVVGEPADEQHPPTAHAGADQVVDEGDEVVVDGSGSSDPDGDPLGYAWTLVDGPAAVDLIGDGPGRQVTLPVDGTYVFRLTVSDGWGGVDTDEVMVRARDVATLPPTGASTSDLLVTGAMLVLAGGALCLIARRRARVG